MMDLPEGESSKVTDHLPPITIILSCTFVDCSEPEYILHFVRILSIGFGPLSLPIRAKKKERKKGEENRRCDIWLGIC